MAIKNLKVNFLQSGADQVKLSIDSVSAKTDQFGKKDVKAKLGVDDTTVSPKLTAIQARLDALTKRKNSLLLTVDSKQGEYDLARFGQKMDAISRKTANPNISLKGVDTAEIQILGLEASMDRLSDKFGSDGSKAAKEFNQGLEGSGGFPGFMSPEVLVPLITAGLAIVPGLFAIAGGLGATALGAALAIKGSPALQKAGSGLLSDLETTMEGAATVLDKPISVAFSDIKGQLPEIGGLFKQTFAGVAPLISPITSMLMDLVKDVMPGFNSFLMQSQKPLEQFFVTAGQLVGTKLGQFFQQLGPGVASSLSDIEGLLNVFLSLATATAKVSDQIAGIPGIIDKTASSLDKVKGQIAGTNTALGKIPKGNENVFQVINDGVNWLTKHLPAGNKTLLQLAENTKSAGDASGSAAGQIDINRAALVKAASAQLSLQSALGGVAVKIGAQDLALQQATKDWQRYFGILGSGQAALSTVSTDVTNVTTALKKYGSGSLEANAAVGQLIQDDETLITALMSQAKAAGNTSAANKAMRDAFLDAARSQLTAADGSKTLQGALVLQAQQAGINVHSWDQLKKMLDAGKGGLDAASKSTDNLSQQQEANTRMAAKMSQAHAILTKVLAQVQLQGGLTASQADKLSSAIQHNTGEVDVSRKAFEAFAGQLGISKSQADKLWGSLKNVAGDYNALVNVKVAGGGTVTASVSVAQALQQAAKNASVNAKAASLSPHIIPAATGTLITAGTTPTADDVHVMASKGETVVSAAHSRILAPAFRALGVPGYGNIPPVTGHYAAGGLIGASSAFNRASSVGSALGKITEPAYAQHVGQLTADEVTQVLGSALASAVQSAVQQAESYGPPGGATGSEMANGQELYQYLLANVFHGAKIAAAGATASIWGESTWNPFAQGTGGRGLIGWTPPGTISNADFAGGMRTQLPAIVRFIGTSGDWGVIREMEGASSILEAANLWGKGVERYGINDVHSTGLALAAQIMGASANQPTGHGNTPTGLAVSAAGTYGDGGWINEPVYGRGMRSGANYLFGERGREYVVPQDRMISGSSLGGDTYHISVAGDTDPDGAALRIIQKVRDYKRHHGGQATGIG